MVGSFLACLGSFAVVSVCALPATAAPEFADVQMRCAVSAKDSRLTGYAAKLVLDESGSAFSIRPESAAHRSITVSYDEIVKAVVELASSAKPEPGSTQPERHYWFYFQRKRGGYPDRFVIEMGEQGAGALTTMRPILGARLQELNFPMAQELPDLSSLTDLASNYSVHVQRPGPPPPAVQKGKALVVAVCPATEGSRKQPVNLDANGRVIAVNEPGTYSFVNLDPGVYTILAQAGNARWLRVTLEVGKTYYFFQDPLDGGEKTGLSMHSPEIAMFEIAGEAYSDWRRDRY